jgi:hypothetical protein
MNMVSPSLIYFVYFLAGSMLRSASRYKALDETAVLGYACRHEFPGGFLNLKHGEQYESHPE